ncbi:MAG: YbjQ family protein [Actinomycetota bacterium]|nr:YbjQ family protein [Actinomycetota bacterium]
MKSRLPILNTETVPGREITEVLGLVQGHTIYAIWLGNDLSAIVRLLIGGELTEYTEMMGKARTLAVERMVGEAEQLGADAVVNVRLMTASVVGSAAELLAYGTAVRMR